MININRKKKQSGAALLAFMLILITGASYLLVSKLNTNLIKVGGEERTRFALNQAKQALIGYAVMFPEIDAKTGTDPIDGPGYLPCPDINNNGIAGGSCALTNTANPSSIGRYPYISMEIQDIRDSNGERLWYIVSNNFRNNPKLEPLNSETSGDTSGNLTVNGVSDVAAVIVAPGAPQNGQNRNTGPNNYNNYLELTISGDAQTITFSNTDNYILLTREELMRAVEKRVLGEVKVFLSNYRSTYGAYPWLTPFSDPKSYFRNLRSNHNGSSNSSSLIDTSIDFTEWDIQPGDIVRNLTDGSIARVTTVATNSLTLGNLSFGTDNDFDNGDQYVVFKNNWNTNLLGGTAGAGSNNLVLIDSGKDFEEYGIHAGDIIDNVNDVSSGVIESVSGSQITVASLTAGAFDSGDVYQIRSNIGQATSSGSDLTDSNKDFTVMGVQTGDLVVNLTDGSFTTVKSVSADTLSLNKLIHGTNNTFASNDYYYLPRYVTDNNSRKGLLSFHEPGNYFKSAFTVEWDIPQANGATVTTSVAATSPDAVYQAALADHVEGGISTMNIDYDDGHCIWTTEQIAECSGRYEDIFLQGTVTAGNNSVFLTDSSKNFNLLGIKPGDIIQNYDDTSFITSGTADAGSGELLLVDTNVDFSTIDPSGKYNFVITRNGDLDTIAVIEEFIDGPNPGEKNTIRLKPAPADANITFSAGNSWEARQPQRLVVSSVTANDTIYSVQTTGATPDFDGGLDEYYRILTATGSISGTADTGSSGFTLVDLSADFSAIEVGDIIENTTDGSFGRVASVSNITKTITAAMYVPTNPATSTTAPFNIGDNYTIHYDYVGARRYDFRFVYSGIPRVYGLNNLRKRDVCIGFVDGGGSPDCSVSATMQATTLPSNNGIAAVTFTDLLDITEVTAATASATIPVAGTASGSIKVSNLDYYLREDDAEIPEWFVKNKWQQLVYVAYSEDYIPGGAADCQSSGNCLTLSGAGIPDNNKIAVVIIAGNELAAQNRAAAGITDYFEMENASVGDDTFQHGSITTAYNDQGRVIE